MRYQKILRERTLFLMTLRKMGLLYFAPIAILAVLIPILTISNLHFYGYTDRAYRNIFIDFQKYLPFIGCWWVLFGLSDYVDESSGELLRVYKKSLLDLFWLLFGWYVLHVLILFAVYGRIVTNFWMDFPVIFSQMLAFAAGSFFLLSVTGTLLVPFLTALLYELFAMMTNAIPPGFTTLFCDDRLLSPVQWIPYAVLALFAIDLIFLGNAYFQKGKSRFLK